MSKNIIVIGSCNTDMVIKAARSRRNSNGWQFHDEPRR